MDVVEQLRRYTMEQTVTLGTISEFRQAARARGQSASALSEAVRRLENLGIPLLEAHAQRHTTPFMATCPDITLEVVLDNNFVAVAAAPSYLARRAGTSVRPAGRTCTARPTPKQAWPGQRRARRSRRLQCLLCRHNRRGRGCRRIQR